MLVIAVFPRRIFTELKYTGMRFIIVYNGNFKENR